MASVTGLTAVRMKLIEALCVISGTVSGDNLILTRQDGTQINAGNVRGAKGEKGDTGSISASAAGGDLSGNYPNPTIKDALKDAIASIASMRTLGTGANQAAPGPSVADSGWVNFVPTAGDAPFDSTASTYAQYRKIGKQVQVRVARTSLSAWNVSANTNGDLPNTYVFGPNSVPLVARPAGQNVQGRGSIAGIPLTIAAMVDGGILITGGFGNNYASGTNMSADFSFFTDN